MNSRMTCSCRGLALGTLIAATCLSMPCAARASKYTPAEWRQLVTSGPQRRFIGQLKHFGWIRDRNLNYIDDEIERRFRPGDSMNVIVELNQSIASDTTSFWLKKFGDIAYMGQLISCVYLRRVPFNVLDSLASHPAVAMVEWQAPIRSELDVAGRAVEAEKSLTYAADVAARDYGSGLDGSGVRIAVVDDGIFDQHPANPSGDNPALNGVVVGGFDATVYEDLNLNEIDDSCEGAGATCTGPGDEKGDGRTNPDPAPGEDHGTHIAGIIAARPIAGVQCRTPDDGSSPVHCSGIAPKSEIFDIKVCTANHVCDFPDDAVPSTIVSSDVMQGLDWVGRHASEPGINIRIVNISLSDGIDDDGTSSLCQEVDYLARHGIIPIVAHGNSGSIATQGTQRTASPGAASEAITVGALYDHGTVKRTDDGHYDQYLVGPRTNPPSVTYDPLAFKPDLAAPGQAIMTTAYTTTGGAKYFPESGTSAATAVVSGAAALVVQQRPWIDAGSLKRLLQSTADKRLVPTSGWDNAYGQGFLDIAAAVSRDPVGDVTFDSCDGAAGSSTEPCPLKSGVPVWNNYMDLSTDKPPQANVPNKVTAMVKNRGDKDADALVTFGEYRFGVVTNFDIIGRVEAHLPHGVATPVTIDWTPKSEAHQCIQAHIDYGDDTEFRDNTTQLNLSVAPSEYPIVVENPFMTRARFHVVPVSKRKGWNCSVDQADFELGGSEGPKGLQVSFHAPAGAGPGQEATCDVAVYGTPAGSRDSVLVGGVTVKTYVPTPCWLVGQVVAANSKPVVGAKVVFHRDLPKGLMRASFERDRVATTNAHGVFQLEVQPDVVQSVAISAPKIGAGIVTIRPRCGVGALRVELNRAGARLLPACLSDAPAVQGEGR